MKKQSENINKVCSPLKYPRRPGSDDSGRDYEIKITALLSLRCATTKDTQNMWIGSNVDQVGDFDDVVVFKQTADANIAYLIQLKHQETPKNINPSDFTHSTKNKGKRKKSKEDFSLAKYSVSFLELKNRLSEVITDEFEITASLRKADRIFYVLFTNRGVNDCDFLEKICDNTLCFLNTCYNNKENIYKFSDKLDYDSDFLQQLILFSNQAHLSDIDGLIQNEIKRLMGSLELTNADLKSASDKFTSFIRTWAKGIATTDNSKLCYALTKSNIINKITDILLEPYKLNFSKELVTFYDCEQKAKWNKFIRNIQITIIDFDESIVEFLKQYIGSELKEYCEEPAKTWSENLTKKAQNLLYKQHEALHTEILRTVQSHNKITLCDIYKSLWFMQKLPILLQINDVKGYQNVARILKILNYNLYVIIIIKQSDAMIKSDAKKYFTNLNDLNAEDRSVILNETVKLQGRASIILGEILDESMYQHIKCKDIIKILSGDFSIGNAYEPLPEYFIQRDLSKIILKREVLSQLNKELFLLHNVPNDFIDESNCYQANNTMEQINELKCLKRPIHELNYYDEKHFEWKQSYGCIKNVAQFQTESKMWVESRHVLEEALNTTYIISAGPGMGKSILMDFIAHHAPAYIWVLKINLNDHDEYYESKKRKKNKVEDYLIHFNDVMLEADTNRTLSKIAFKKLLDKKQVLILLDGFDEISVAYKREVTEIARLFHKEGFCMWITTRPVMKSHLEEEFNTIALTLKPFTIDDQETFLHKYFSQTISEVDDHQILKEFVRKLLQAARINLNDKDCQFTGIPLQTRLLADVFNEECKECVIKKTVELKEKFDLLYLYDEFIKNKTNIVCDKFGKGVKQMRVLFEKHQQLFALKILFRKDDLSDLNIEEELDEYYEDKQCKVQFLQREGVVVVHESNAVTEHTFYVRFIHRTFAEYLAAQWLADNFNNEDIEDTIENIMKKRFPPLKLHPFLFNMFDRILAADYPLHSAIINERMDEIENNINSEDLNTVDDGGRSILHILALSGIYHPYQAIFNNSSYAQDKMVDVIELIPDDAEIIEITDDVMRWNALDYAIANYSLAVANKICEKFSILSFSIPITNAMQQQYFTYCEWFQYKPLFKALLPHFTIRGLVLPFADKTMAVQSLYEQMFNETNEFVTNILLELCTNHYYTDLHFAVAFGTEPNTSDLLNQGRDINKRDFQMNTPLHYAAIRKRLEIVSLLINNGAEINKWGKHLNTALHYAAESGDNDIVSKLIDEGADIDNLNTNDDTPLHFAFLGGHMDTVRLLLSKGANANLANLSGQSILHCAAEYGYDDIILELLRNGDEINKINDFDQTPLHLALQNNNIDTVKLLLCNGASFEKEEGNSVLHYAVGSDKDIVIELLARGANINNQNRKGDTCLNFALRACKVELAKFLITQGAETNINKEGTSTLHFAAAAGADDLIQELIATNDINAVNADGDSPLHFAIKEKHASTSKLLLANGAKEVTDIRKRNSTLHYAAELGDEEIVSLFLAQGSKIDKENLDGDIPLHFAAQNANLAVVDLLITDLTINKPNKLGKTPLHTAIADQRHFTREKFENQKSLVELLLNKGADINIKDFNGNSALHHACMDYFQEFSQFITSNERKLGMINFYTEIVALLLKKGAEIDIRNNDDKSPLDLATDSNNTTIISLLQNSLNQ